MAYNVETILAEKIETILSRGIANTRLRDFYDVFILTRIKRKKYKVATLKEAFAATSQKRGSSNFLSESDKIIERIKTDKQMKLFWNSYQKKFSYAKEIDFSTVCDLLKEICSEIKTATTLDSSSDRR